MVFASTTTTVCAIPTHTFCDCASTLLGRDGARVDFAAFNQELAKQFMKTLESVPASQTTSGSTNR